MAESAAAWQRPAGVTDESHDRSRGDARTRIVAAATELLEEVPFHELSMRRVAKRAGVSVGTVTYHYASRHELLEDCLEPFNDVLVRALERAKGAFVSGASFDQQCVDTVRTVYPELLELRTLVRLRLIRTLEADGYPRHHDRLLRMPFLHLAAGLVPNAPVSPPLLLISLATMVARLVSLPPQELIQVTGRDTLAEAEADVLRCLEFIVERVLAPPEHEGTSA